MSGPGGAERHRRYKLHGEGFDSLSTGFNALVMPEARRTTAVAIVHEVLEANGALLLKWYMTPGTPEVACFWDDETQNTLWITAGHVHVAAESTTVIRSARPVNWEKADGRYVGWLLPGAAAGDGGGKRACQVATVLCPEAFVMVPAGIVCDYCGVDHSIEEA